MKVSFTLITAVVAGLASADCPAMVDTALGLSVTALQTGLKVIPAGLAPSPDIVKAATDAGGDCFKKTIGCPVAPRDPPPAAPPIDCSGATETALNSAVAALKAGLGLFVPGNFQAGVDAGVACFKKTLGCKGA